jgi:uncharacterized membrane protein
MKCKKCGANNDRSVKICNSCGHIINGEKVVVNTQQDEMDDISRNKLMAVLCYLGVLIVIPYFQARNSRYVQFHLKQGVNLLIFDLICGFITGFINSFIEIGDELDYLNNMFLLIISVPLAIIGLIIFIITISGIINAVSGKMKKLPIIGNFEIIK